MSKMSPRQRWKQTSIANQLMVVSTGIMAFATVFLVIAGILQYLAAREQLQAVREQGNVMQRQLDAFKESSSQTTNQTNDLIAATKDTANASASVAKQNEELVKHAGEQASASQTQANASVVQAETAKQSLGVIRTSARAVEQSAEVARQSFDIGERPYIAIKRMGIINLELGKTPVGIAVLENAGRTPATNVLIHTTVEYRQTPLPINPVPPPTTQPDTLSFMPPSDEKTMNVSFTGVVSQADLDALKAGKVLIYIYGFATYEGGLRRKHTLLYCGIYSPEKAGFDVCAYYNGSN
jgi:hypothetical protein